MKCFLDFFFSFVNLLSLSCCERTQVSFMPASMHRLNLNNKSQSSEVKLVAVTPTSKVDINQTVKGAEIDKK